MKLSDITEKTPLVRDFVNRLAKTAKQQVAVVDVLRVSRVSGVSARPVHIALEGGQVIKIYIRTATKDDDSDGLDLFRVDINSKTQATAGDFDNSYKPSFNASVDEIANIVTKGQAAFSRRRAKKPVVRTKNSRAPQNKNQILKALREEDAQLNKQIEQKTQEKALLEAKLEQVINQNITS